jgi:hypothetical protein
MRKISVLFVAVALLFSGNLLATEGVDPCSEDLKFLEPAPSNIADQVEHLLKENDGFDLREADELSAIVRFMVNSEKELVVISVRTEEERLENFVKGRLNYEKVEDQTLEVGKIYTLPIRLRA